MNDFVPSVTLRSVTTSSTKFNLYLKTRELKAVSEVVRQVLILPKLERQSWVEEHGDWLQDAFDTCLQESNLTLEEISLDEETMELSQELVISLRDTMSMVNGILIESEQLPS
ncbi:MAG: hypothetical protein WDZ94_02905 [Patescibacteria group bacterium]